MRAAYGIAISLVLQVLIFGSSGPPHLMTTQLSFFGRDNGMATAFTYCTYRQENFLDTDLL